MLAYVAEPSFILTFFTLTFLSLIFLSLIFFKLCISLESYEVPCLTAPSLVFISLTAKPVTSIVAPLWTSPASLLALSRGASILRWKEKYQPVCAGEMTCIFLLLSHPLVPGWQVVHSVA